MTRGGRWPAVCPQGLPPTNPDPSGILEPSTRYLEGRPRPHSPGRGRNEASRVLGKTGSPALHRAKSLHCLLPQERGFEVTRPLSSSSTPGLSAWLSASAHSARSAGPGLPVIRVLVAPVHPQRRGALGLGQSCRQGGQVGGRAGEGAAPSGLRGALQPEPRTAPPTCPRCPAHPAWPHQQPVAGVALEVLLPSDGAVVLTWGKKRHRCLHGSSRPHGPSLQDPVCKWPAQALTT